MELSLKDKRALICGSSSGIGLASAVELSKLGAECVLLARDEERLQHALQQLEGEEQHSYLLADFNMPEQVETAVHSFLQRKGPVHILVNNTGGPAGGPVLEAAPEAFINACQQHLICNQLLARAVVPGMRNAGYGRIINIISISVKAPIPNLGVSNTARWAVAAWAKTLAGEVAGDGITVNNVLPGSTLTGRLRSLLEARVAQRKATKEDILKEWLADIPMGRFGEASEIANLVAFLASPAASYITGTSIQVDGGKTPVM
jgi:3-oxoacyl-[acyl-carrier protein] reductase